MATVFNNNKFFPQHFLLTSDSDVNLNNQAETICKEAFQLSPESFNGEKLFFKYILSYCQPYEYEKFQGLRRLQEVARSNTRFKDEYRGYILIDISEWKGHLTEELFADVTMPFLSDMSMFWKYLFVSPGYERSESELNVLKRFFRVKQLDAASFPKPDLYKTFFDSMNKNHGIRFSKLTENVFRRFIPNEAMRSVQNVIAIKNDIISFFGTHVNVKAEMIVDYLKNPDSFCFNLISEENMQKLVHIHKEEIIL